ncbi:hypothetical protein GCM10027061_08520 [Nesterenkonia suensis]
MSVDEDAASGSSLQIDATLVAEACDPSLDEVLNFSITEGEQRASMWLEGKVD